NKALAALASTPYFTAKQAKEYGITSAQLAYYVKKEEIKRLARGVYKGNNFPFPSEHFQWEDLIETLNSIPGGTVCLISALALYNITEQIPRQHWIAVSHKTSIKERKNTRIVRFRNMGIGRTIFSFGEVQIPIFDRERTIIDAFRMLSKETAIKALKMALNAKGKDRINLIKLQDYAKKLRFNISPYLLTLTT
ncbi:MAG: type IV toxin-antitoxin system AbiEi family antitoxin domain-containing protein, partial [Parachlamydiaceae bacterium]